ncbi:MAG: arsenate reductase family protein [Baekduiaceae bacterium]
MSDVIVYEKRTCTTCKKLAHLLEERGIGFDRVEYHVEGLTEPQIRDLLTRSGVTAHQALRRREPLVAELGLTGPDVTEDQLVALMAEHPQLLERPFVVRGDRAVFARPIELALTLFD